MRSALNCIAFALGFLPACLLLHALGPFPDISEVTRKLDYFSARKDRFDTLFFGSSRTFRQISPLLFDAETKALGHPTASFNFGIDGMFPPETFYLIDEVLARKPARLKSVFIELSELRTSAGDNPDALTSRDVYWHDFERTSLELRKLWAATGNGKRHRTVRDCTRDLLRRIKQSFSPVINELELCFLNYSNSGRGPEMLRHLLSLDPPPTYALLGPNGDGFRNTAGANFNGDPADYRKKVAALPLQKRKGADKITDEILQEFLAKLRREGVTPILVIAPDIYPLRPFLQNAQPHPALLEFDEPLKYPSLYELNHRKDGGHLNPAGAQEYSRLLAAKFVENLVSGKQD